MMDREVFGVSTADFDVQGFVSESLTGSTTASHVVAHLDEDLKRLDEDLKGEILLRQEGLLQSLDSLGDVEAFVAKQLKVSANELTVGAKQIKEEQRRALDQLKELVELRDRALDQLGLVTTTTSFRRALMDLRKLVPTADNSAPLSLEQAAKAAKLLAHLEELRVLHPRLAHVDIVSDNFPFMNAVRKDVLSLARDAIRSAAADDYADARLAFQVLGDLTELSGWTSGWIAEASATLESELSAALKDLPSLAAFLKSQKRQLDRARVLDRTVQGAAGLEDALRAKTKRALGATAKLEAGAFPEVIKLVKDHVPELLGGLDAARKAWRASQAGKLKRHTDTLWPSRETRALPTQSDVKRWSSEVLQVLSVTADLREDAADAVAKAVTMLAERARGSIVSGSEVSRVSGPATAGTRRNSELSNTLVTLREGLLQMGATTASLTNAIGVVEEVAVEAIAPLFQALRDLLASSVATLHEEDWVRRGTGDDTSVYLSTLLHSLHHVRREYLHRLTTSATANALVTKLASSTLSAFTRHASLVRAGPSARASLAGDMREVERAVGSNLCPLEALGEPLLAFRAFAAVLETETGDLGGRESDLRAAPQADLVHHLLTRLPAAMQSPQEASGLPAAKYVVWMDQHSTPEVLRAAGEAVEGFRTGAEGEAAQALSVATAAIERAQLQ